MSLISNIHTATIYEPKTSKPFDGQRLVKTIAKADAKGNYGPHLQQTMATSIPQLTADSIVDAMNDDGLQVRLMPHFVQFLEGVQNSLISDRIKIDQKMVSTTELEIAALCDYLDADSVGERWDAARVASWFTSNIAELFATRLLEKGVSDADLEGKLVTTSKRFSEALASKAKIHPAVAVKLLEVLGLCEDKGGVIYKRFEARLVPVESTDALDFGF